MTSETSPAQTGPSTRDGGRQPRITIQRQQNGDTRVDLMDGERSLSRLWVIPLTIRIGAATVRMDGIGGVGTEEDCRNRGYSRRVLEATVDWMRQGDAGLSMLYGIPNFYPKFGYATAGPDHLIELKRLGDPAVLPAGWCVRPCAAADLPAARRLYEQNSALGVGAAVRAPEAHGWSRLATPDPKHPHDCRVIEGPEGQVRAYAWRARWHWYVGILERQHPDALILSEVMADGPASADAVLAACRQWAVEEPAARPEPVAKVLIAVPPEGPVAAGAMRQAALFLQSYSPCGGSMARVLSVGRLLEALRPELARRLQAVGSPFAGTLRFQTDLGGATLVVTGDGVTVEATNDSDALSTEMPPARRPTRAGGAESLVIRLPQSTLARLALGVFPPEDLLDRLGQPVDGRTQEMIRTLFPRRHPHMYLPDRY
jgi:GNAT superfamily N-acetyltransferase